MTNRNGGTPMQTPLVHNLALIALDVILAIWLIHIW